MNLTKPDRAEYEFHHRIIQAGKATWLEVGTSLMVMRETGVAVEERHRETMQALRELAAHMREDIDDTEEHHD